MAISLLDAEVVGMANGLLPSLRIDGPLCSQELRSATGLLCEAHGDPGHVVEAGLECPHDQRLSSRTGLSPIYACFGRVVSREIPPVRVARTIYRGSYEQLANGWEEFAAWMAMTGHVPGPDLHECYTVGPE